MSYEDSANGWGEWSRHVLKELQRLNVGQETIHHEIRGIKENMAKVSIIENQIAEVKDWKSDITEIVSPTQLKDLVDNVNQLEKFKIKAAAAFGAVQIIFGVLIAIFK